MNINTTIFTSKTAIRLFTDAKGKTLPHVDDEWREGDQGATVELTIDFEFQQVVERELSQAMVNYNADQALSDGDESKDGRNFSPCILSYLRS